MPSAPSPEPQVSIVDSGQKRSYHAPELTELGPMAEVTHAGGGGAYTFDGSSYGS
jgi:hypothetical protein